MNVDPRIGTPDRRPDVTISGQPYTRPATTRGLSLPGCYVVLDVHTPRGFDLESEIASLNALIEDAAKPKQRSLKVSPNSRAEGMPTHDEPSTSE